MVLFVGQIETRMREREAFQEVDYRAAFGRSRSGRWRSTSADRVAEIVARAFAVAQTGRPGPVVVALPEDMLSATTAVAAGPAVGCRWRARRRRTLTEATACSRGGAAAAAGRGRRLVRGRARRAARLRRGEPAPGRLRLPLTRTSSTTPSPGYAGDAGLGKTPRVRALLGRRT